MFKAINQQTDQDIIILDPKWGNRLEQLRALDRQDHLVCQRCRQPVRIRAGQVRSWHFAHKHLRNCPLQSESPELLLARVTLYEWLRKKFGNAVTLEKEIGGANLSRPVDCWVEVKAGVFAYWIIEVQLKPEHRQEIKHALEQSGAMVNWVFLAKMLREEESGSGQLHLTTTEREFMTQTEYDQIARGFRADPGQSLHYLDPGNASLVTFRSLHLIHSPQLYAGCQESHPLAEVLVSPKTGEFVHTRRTRAAAGLESGGSQGRTGVGRGKTETASPEKSQVEKEARISWT